VKRLDPAFFGIGALKVRPELLRASPTRCFVPLPNPDVTRLATFSLPLPRPISVKLQIDSPFFFS
jgi:hypothetical protein